MKERSICYIFFWLVQNTTTRTNNSFATHRLLHLSILVGGNNYVIRAAWKNKLNIANSNSPNYGVRIQYLWCPGHRAPATVLAHVARLLKSSRASLSFGRTKRNWWEVGGWSVLAWVQYRFLGGVDYIWWVVLVRLFLFTCFFYLM